MTNLELYKVLSEKADIASHMGPKDEYERLVAMRDGIKLSPEEKAELQKVPGFNKAEIMQGIDLVVDVIKYAKMKLGR